MEEKKLNEQPEVKGEDMNEEALEALAGGGSNTDRRDPFADSAKMQALLDAAKWHG